MKRLALLALTALLATACSDTPTAPSRIATAPVFGHNDGSIAGKRTTKASSTFPSIGHATTVNTTGARACFWLAAWDATASDVNQTFIQGDSALRCVDAGATAEGWLSFDETKFCKIQVDWFVFPADATVRTDRPTLADLANNFWDASGSFHMPACVVPPSPPVTPEPPEPPPSTCGAPLTFTFPQGSTIARYPDAFQLPLPNPSSLGPFSFAVPVGVYHITALNGDDHSGKNDGPQDERGNYEWNNGWVLGPTTDVPDGADVAVTDFGVRALISDLTSFRFVHNTVWPVESATGSFSPLSLTFTCVEPQAARTR